MVGSSKILTVQYGTFSCTAEGFEDPLGTVKDTTHFFRHVVKQDRFFGAEPPRFDAALAEEMLRAQFAADLRDGHLTLRATPTHASPQAGFSIDGRVRAAASTDLAGDAQDAPDVSPRVPAHGDATAALRAGSAPDMDDARPSPPADDPQDHGWTETADQTEPISPAPEAPHDQVAEKLARIRAVVGASAAASWNDDTDRHPESTDRAAGGVAAQHQDEDPAQGGQLARHATAEQAVDHARGQALDAARPAAQDDLTPPVHTLTPHDAAAGAGPLDDAPDHGASEPEGMPPPVSQYGEPAHVAENVYVGVNDALAATEASGNETPDDDTPANDCAEAHAEEIGEDGAAEPAPAEATPEAADDSYDPARVPRDTQPAIDQWSADAWPEDAAVEETEEAPDLRVAGASGDTATAPVLGERSDRLGAESSLPPEEEAELARELAAVRAELEAGDVTDSTATPFRLDNPILSDDDDDAGKDEIGEGDAVEDNNAEGPRQPEDNVLARASAGARKAVRLASPARAMLTEKSVGDTDASRLLAQTNSELDEPEGNRRRSAIAHLRAAVAATRADRALHADDTDAETERYREDLAKVVRPRRPKVLRTVRSERPASEPQAAPVQLVPQQRAEEAPPEPVRPRRVSIADDIGPAPSFDPEDDAGGGFADYAASVGATRLPDLLEAAAAYMAFVEGRDQFSRPQLMTVLQRVGGGTATREERLRSFGRLLRDGKIEKTRGGRFTASDRIGFRPEARQVG